MYATLERIPFLLYCNFESEYGEINCNKAIILIAPDQKQISLKSIKHVSKFNEGKAVTACQEKAKFYPKLPSDQGKT